MELHFDLKYFVALTLSFISFTIVGTLSHECGHIFIAQSLGYDTKLHFGSMSWDNESQFKRLEQIERLSRNQPDNADILKLKRESNAIKEALKADRLAVSLGGPLQTIGTGILGLLILLFQKRKLAIGEMTIVDWLGVFLSLFWLRQIFNLVMSIVHELFLPNGSYFGGDERQISELLGLWQGTLPLCLAILGLIVVSFICLKVLPPKIRFSFMLSGLVGGTMGYLLWFMILGPQILP